MAGDLSRFVELLKAWSRQCVVQFRNLRRDCIAVVFSCCSGVGAAVFATMSGAANP